jgi:hypothetical protein
MHNYEAIVIGTGQSGRALARRPVAAPQKVAVSPRKFFSVNTGMQALVASACRTVGWPPRPPQHHSRSYFRVGL